MTVVEFTELLANSARDDVSFDVESVSFVYEGDKFKVTLDNGQVFVVTISEQKAKEAANC